MMLKDDQAIPSPDFLNTTEGLTDSSPDVSDSPSSVEPIRIRDSRGIIELTKALKSADKALVVWTLRGWIAHNQAKNKAYRDGHYWTFSPLDRWQEKYFPWLSLKQLGTIMTQLVTLGVLVRTRRNVHCCYWYRVNESVLMALCASLPPAQSLISQTSELTSQTAGLISLSSDQSAETSEHKTVVKKQENLKQRKHKESQTTTPPPDTEVDPQTQTDVVVVPMPHPTPERNEESGEHSLDGESSQTAPRHARASSAMVKAQDRDGTEDNNAPIPHSAAPLTPLQEALLIDFDILPTVAAGYIKTYGEDRVREVMDYTRLQADIKKPAGFLIAALRDKLDVRPLMLKFDQPVSVLAPMPLSEDDQSMDDSDDTPPPAKPDRTAPVEDHIWPQFIAACADVPELSQMQPRALFLDGKISQYTLTPPTPEVRQTINAKSMTLRKRLEQIAGYSIHIFVEADSRRTLHKYEQTLSLEYA